jgi:hypothetical protein
VVIAPFVPSKLSRQLFTATVNQKVTDGLALSTAWRRSIQNSEDRADARLEMRIGLFSSVDTAALELCSNELANDALAPGSFLVVE